MTTQHEKDQEAAPGYSTASERKTFADGRAHARKELIARLRSELGPTGGFLTGEKARWQVRWTEIERIFEELETE